MCSTRRWSLLQLTENDSRHIAPLNRFDPFPQHALDETKQQTFAHYRSCRDRALVHIHDNVSVTAACSSWRSPMYRQY
jgi:hypothetical protein